MDIAPVSEIFLNEDGVVEETAPSSVLVEVYKGILGTRTTYIIPGFGNPNTYDFANEQITGSTGQLQTLTPQPFDWYVNLRTTDPDYLTMYYLNSSGESWERIFKISPNVVHKSFVGTFASGVLSTIISIPKETLLLEQIFGQDLTGWETERTTNITIDAESTIGSTLYPTAIGFEAGTPTSDEENYYFPIVITASELTESGFAAVSGDRILHISISVI